MAELRAGAPLASVFAELSVDSIVSGAPRLLEGLIEQGRLDDARELMSVMLTKIREGDKRHVGPDIIAFISAQLALDGREAALGLWRESLDGLKTQECSGRRLKSRSPEFVAAALALDRVDDLVEITRQLRGEPRAKNGDMKRTHAHRVATRVAIRGESERA